MRKKGPRQLSFVFADSPSGGGKDERSDASEQRRPLLQKAKRRKASSPNASAADTGGTLEDAAAEANLATALFNVMHNKGAPGVDGQTVEEAEAKASAIIARLRRDLLEGRYRPGDVRRVWLPKPGGGRRGLGIPNIVDRLVQQALLQVMEPIFEPTFHPSSHGFRPRRRGIAELTEATGYLKDGYQTVVDLDLAKFFDRVHHQRLLARIAERVKDPRIVALVRLMLKAAVIMPDGTKIAVQEGTPLEGPLSPCFPISCSTSWTANWRSEVCGLFATLMIAISSCAASAPESASWRQGFGDFWRRACGFKSTRRRVAYAHPTRFKSWASAFNAREGRKATRSPSFLRQS